MEHHAITRRAALLAINLLFLMVWGFAGIDKAIHGPPSWFEGKFGGTILGKFPGTTASFWMLAAAELVVLGLSIAALARVDFLERRPPVVLGWTLAGSLFVFVQLGFGQWLTSDFAGAAQQFSYFAGTLVALHFVVGSRPFSKG